MEDQINETNKTIQLSDAEAKYLGGDNDKLKGDSLSIQKSYQNEALKNTELSVKLGNQENSLEAKDLQTTDLKTEIDVLKRVHSAAIDNYGNLVHELDSVKQQIRIMEQNNEEVILKYTHI